MATRYSRRLYPYRRSRRLYGGSRFTKRYSSAYGRRGYIRGYGTYWGGIARAAAPYAIRALPYISKGYSAYRRGGFTGLKRYAGKLASTAAKSAIKSVTGYGAYKVGGSYGMSGLQAPKILNGASADGSVVISHREFLGDVLSGSNSPYFAISEYTINPGNDNTFPWLSQIAKNFQEWRLEGMAFHYRTMSADALSATNTALGTVMMATQYDPMLPTPLSKQQMDNLEFSQSVKPSQSCVHYIECAKGQTPLTNMYVAPGPEQQVGDPRFYDFGKFFIATQGVQTGSVNLGELWVTYQIRLFKPMLFDALGKESDWFQVRTTNGLTENSGPAPFGHYNFGAEANFGLINPNSTLIPLVNTSTYFRFEQPNAPKTYLITMHWIVPAAKTGPMLVNTVTTNKCSINTGLMGGNSHLVAPEPGGAGDSNERVTITTFVNCENTDLSSSYWQLNVSFVSMGTTADSSGNYADVFQMDVIEIPYQQRT